MAGPERELLDLARDLKQTADGKVLLKELLKGIGKVAKDEVVPKSRLNALAKLPAGGGLNKAVARAPQRVTSRAGATTATVAVVLSGRKRGSGAVGADNGQVRHPLFGNRERWFTTKVPPHWFTETGDKAAPAVRRAAEAAIEQTARDAGFR